MELLKEIKRIRKQISTPRFAAKEFVITSYGAVGDEITLNIEVFSKATKARNKSGGRVIVPAGNFSDRSHSPEKQLFYEQPGNFMSAIRNI